ncbi:MAG: ABC transporter ATP-binding protein [Ilumatobacteraceae bacterium]
MLEVTGLSVAVQAGDSRTTIVDDIDWSVGAGETLGLVGESGSGKTMSAHAVLGLLRPPVTVTAGRAMLDGEDLLSIPSGQLRRRRGTRIALVTQDSMSALNPTATVGAQIAEVFTVHTGMPRREALRRAVAALGRVGIADAARRAGDHPHQFSGGMRQRVVIAMALALDPAVVIADEPTTALDVTVQAQILQLLRELQSETGMGLVLISHDLPVVAQLADRIAVMRAGRIVETGPTAEVLASPRHPDTLEIVAATDIARGGRRIAAPAVAPAASDAPALLELRGVVKRYGRTRRGRPPIVAVDHVDLALHADEVVGLVGESGSGKTTVARLLAALERPTAGQVLHRGADLAALPRQELRRRRRDIQVIFQDPYAALNPRKRVAALLAEPWIIHPELEPHRRHRDAAAELLDAVGLPSSLLDRFPAQLSGGQRQRLGIARALALRPQVLICDEPLSSLDLTTQNQVIELLLRVRAELGMSYLLVSHDLLTVRRLCSRVLVMRHGEIVESGLTANVFARPRHEYTRTLLAATPTWLRDEVPTGALAPRAV